MSVRNCPPWCDDEHDQYAVEVPGASIAEIELHRGSIAAQAPRSEDPGRAAWDISLEQSLGGRTVLTLQFGAGAVRRLESGDARVLAAQLVFAADRIDLSTSS